MLHGWAGDNTVDGRNPAPHSNHGQSLLVGIYRAIRLVDRVIDFHLLKTIFLFSAEGNLSLHMLGFHFIWLCWAPAQNEERASELPSVWWGAVWEVVTLWKHPKVRLEFA